MSLRALFDVEHAIIQAPMAGVQDSALAIAVCNAGGLGSMPCAMLRPASLREELERLTAQTDRPYNVNFFSHPAPAPNAARDATWRAALAPYYRVLALDMGGVAGDGAREPFNEEAANVLSEFKP